MLGKKLFKKSLTNFLEESELLNSSSKFLFSVVSGLSEIIVGTFNLDLLSLIFKVDFFGTGR